jgi:hypothetical protein
MTCGVITYVKIPLIFLSGTYDFGAALHVGPTCGSYVSATDETNKINCTEEDSNSGSAAE